VEVPQVEALQAEVLQVLALWVQISQVLAVQAETLHVLVLQALILQVAILPALVLPSPSARTQCKTAYYRRLRPHPRRQNRRLTLVTDEVGWLPHGCLEPTAGSAGMGTGIGGGAKDGT